MNDQNGFDSPAFSSGTEKMTFGSGGFPGSDPYQNPAAPTGPQVPAPPPAGAPYPPQDPYAAYRGAYPAPDARGENRFELPVSLGEWIWSLLLLSVPIVGVIAAFYFAFGDCKTSKKNFFRALLIFALIGIVFAIVITIVSVILFSSLDLGSLTSEVGRV